ncbi:MAG TPA: ATP-binding protein [Accumulibacter sp.]|uniref:ATP-binding protein n=1 Tax=Accumulibacter sp. TaxID=2053492 RepID=UPI000EE03B5F|nr:ATP-binding protein [Accumulibacter sp.]HCZ15343.1 AAA family ATPase [Accumulibacter sp.]HRD87272.1 ATP-binding protein [Accumulibacter sp.]
MLPRVLADTLHRLAQSFPVVTITGPRHSGKTTLARAVFADRAYVSLEDPIERAFAFEDPRGFLARFEQGAVFDEAQRWPDLFSYLQGIVDTHRAPGRFVLTGSQQFGLRAGVTQSLAGRVGLTRLLPLAFAEIPAASRQLSIDSMMLLGGYPLLHTQPIMAADWFASYVATYVERDVRQILNVQDIGRFQRFLRLCAGRSGQLLNLSALAGEAGISHSTARAWLSVLESSDIVFLLPPYHRSFGKRLVKAPKLYFLDTGLACWLLGIRAPEVLALHPSRGALFETWVVGEFVKSRFNRGLPADLYFWRDNNGLEADLVFEVGTRVQPVKIKSGQTLTRDYLQAGQTSGRFAGNEALPPWLIYGGSDSYERSGVRVIGWRDLAPGYVSPAQPLQ